MSVIWARPGCCAIVTSAAEPRCSRRPSQRHAENTGEHQARRRGRPHDRQRPARRGHVPRGMLRQLEQRRQFVRGGPAADGRQPGSRRGRGRRHRAAQGRGVRLRLRQYGRSGRHWHHGPAGAWRSSIIYTAQLTVRAGDVSSAAAQAAQIAGGVGGYVSSETAKVNPDHPSEATASVQLKIPVAAYPATLGQLGHRLGTQLSLQQQAQDVTQQVADVDSQVASDQAAIAQLRALLSHAGSVGELLSVQNQINSRGSEPGVDAGAAARAQPPDQLRDGDADDPRAEGQAGAAPAEAPAHASGRLRRGLARAAHSRVLDAGVPRRHRAVRRRPGRRRVPGLPRAALAGPSQAGRPGPPRRKASRRPGFRTGREPTRRAPGRPAWPVRPGRFPAARRDRG